MVKIAAKCLPVEIFCAPVSVAMSMTRSGWPSAGSPGKRGGIAVACATPSERTRRPSASVLLISHVARAATKTVALVGKGIVYDTGGLGLKPKEGMCGMKCDMGGAAGLMGAFEAAVAIGTGHTSLHCVLCLAVCGGGCCCR